MFYGFIFFSLRQLLREKWEGTERDLRNEPVAKVVLQTPSQLISKRNNMRPKKRTFELTGC